MERPAIVGSEAEVPAFGPWAAITLAANWASKAGHHPPQYRTNGETTEFRGAAVFTGTLSIGQLITSTLPDEAQPPTEFVSSPCGLFDNGPRDFGTALIFVYPNDDGSAGSIEFHSVATASGSEAHLDGASISIAPAVP